MTVVNGIASNGTALPAKLHNGSSTNRRNAFDNAEADEAWKSNIRGDGSYLTLPDGSRPASWWTGRSPTSDAPGMLADGTITSLPLPNLATCTRKQASEYFENTWLITEVLFSALQGEEAYYRPPYHNLRHPFVFYYGHPAALYVNKMRVAGILTEPVNEYFERIFETGVDEMSWDDLSKNDMTWPALSEITEYRKTAFQLVKKVIDTHPGFDSLPITHDNTLWALFMGFEHERIHIETSSVLMRELPLSLLKRPVQWPRYHPTLQSMLDGQTDGQNDGKLGSVPENPMIEVPAGDAVLGKAAEWPSFGWDNEYGNRKFQVDAFKASKCLISNGEFLEFVKAGGYREERWWTADGWKWRTFRNAKWPTFWVPDGPAGLHQFKLRLVFEEVAMPLSLPAVVNHHEAKAYCNWLSARLGLTGHAALRLTTEPEQHKIRQVSVRDASGRAAEDPVMSLTGALFRSTANLNLAYGAESPVDAMKATSAGFHDAMGNVWQWCEDHFAALPNSLGVHVYYDDFSTPCYDGEHNIIMGGSFISTGDMASVFARFHFRPHFFQHAGFRVASGTGPLQTSCMDSPGPHVGDWDPSTVRGRDSASKAAKREDALLQQLLVHYGGTQAVDKALQVPPTWCQLPQAAVKLLLDAAKATEANIECVLEVGCSVGGVSLALAQHVPCVMGVDGSAEAIKMAVAARDTGRVVVPLKESAGSSSEVVLQCPASDSQRSAVVFKQMDACCLAPDLPEFDAVVMVNLMERIVSPCGPLGRLSGQRSLLRKGGLLLISSTFQWSERVSDPKLWLGGPEGRADDAKQALREMLSADFELVSEADLPFLTRKTARKYDLQVAYAGVWRRVR